MLPYLRRSEDWEGGGSARRGAGGPMRVTRPPEPHPIAAAMLDGAAGLGLPRLEDANAGENCGAALANLNIAEGRRFSAVDGYLPAWAPPPAPARFRSGRGRSSRSARQPHRADGDDGRPARLHRPPGDGDGAAAARCSISRAGRCARPARGPRSCSRSAPSAPPSCSIRSGIGDPADLVRLGLPVRAALPGVGANLQDHPLVMGVNFRGRGRLGLARDNGGGAIMNWRSSRAARPDLHAFVVQGRHAYPEAAARYGLNGDADVFAISPGLFGSRGVGRLTVRDLSARARPRSSSSPAS